MRGRRLTYIVLLTAAIILHLVYGQYLTHYMVLFLACVPVISLIVSLPSALGSSVRLMGGADVIRNRESGVRLIVESGSFMPFEECAVTVECRNEFRDSVVSRQRLFLRDTSDRERAFSADTSQLGSVKYTIKRAFVFDRLGLIPIPVKKSDPVAIKVLPDKEKPDPEPDLIGLSSIALKPKPQGFSEEHEMRPYHDGDPLNLIHWKLSRKFNGLIVREPQEIIRREIALVADLPEHYEEHRSVIEQLCYMNATLTDNGIPYRLEYGPNSIFITCADDFDDFFRGVLSEPMKHGKAHLSDVGNDALICRIKPGKADHL